MATRFFPNFKANLITSRFGQRIHPVTRVKTQHNGIDLTATNDGVVGNTDSITAHTGGTVDSVGYSITAGNYVILRVDSRTLMKYQHLKNISNLKKGASVKKGEVLGYMGKTGTATGPHLHWAIEYDGQWIDPEPYLDADWTQPFKLVQISVPVLQRGAKGQQVQALQALLNLRMANSEGWQPLELDGSFGAKTLDAVIAFQGAAGLTQDGSCGALTWTALIEGDGT